MLKLQIMKNMGMRYTLYRIRHEISRKLGVLVMRFPVNAEQKKFIQLDDWKSSNLPFRCREEIGGLISMPNSEKLDSEFHNIISGKICFFNYEWKNLGINYDWVTNPVNGFKYNIDLHWSEIDDFNTLSGDIKYVWEKSRFTYFHTIIRYDYRYEEDHSAFIFSEIKSWIDANPVNKGPNWRCSQEISLRLINWLQAICFYKNSIYLTEDLWADIQNIFYWSLHHIYNNINFSRIAVRNNHAITETLTLTLSNIFLPFIPKTIFWSKKGRTWFETEIDYQIYEDGTFLQFSMNYHRVIIQLLSLGIAITEKFNIPFSTLVYDKAYNSLDFLYQCLQENNGHLPNYGSNDGALFFPLTNSDYRDFRPQLNTLHKILTGSNLYFSSPTILEDAFWTIQSEASLICHKAPLKKISGVISYPIGGYYLIREDSSFTFIRCGNHKDRPAHADNLHIDIWVDGENVLRDSGTYRYNMSSELQEYFTGTRSHNSVIVNNQSQMKKGGRFIWYYWTQAIYGGFRDTEDEYVFEGAISAFRYLNAKAVHKRRVVKKKGLNYWIIEDSVENLEGFVKTQVWHCDSSVVNIVAKVKNLNVFAKKLTSYYSSYYGAIEEKSAIGFDFEKSILTTLVIK